MLEPWYSMVPGAGIEPARPLKSRDFKLYTKSHTQMEKSI